MPSSPRGAPHDHVEQTRRRGGRQSPLRHHGRCAGPAAQGRDGDRLRLAPEVRRQGRQPGRRGGESRCRGPHGRRGRRRRVRALPFGRARRRRRRCIACRAPPRGGVGHERRDLRCRRRLRRRDRVGRQPPRRSRRPRRTGPLAGRARADPPERDARRHQHRGRACGEDGRGDGLPQRRALPPLARRARRAGRPARGQRDRGRAARRPRRDRSRLGGRGGGRRSPGASLPSSSRRAGKASPGCGGARIPWSFRRSPSRSSAPTARAMSSSAPS